MRAMVDQMGTFFTTLEPELREAYAHAYADSFTLDELRDLDSFFTTPTGAKYAARYMTISTDPAVAAETRAMVPKLLQQMPTFLAAGQKATAALPPPRKLKDLDPAQRAALAKALGVKEDQLHDPKTPWIDQRDRLAEHGMYRPEFESDACGVGLVAATDGVASRRVVQSAIDALEGGVAPRRGRCGWQDRGRRGGCTSICRSGSSTMRSRRADTRCCQTGWRSA